MHLMLLSEAIMDCLLELIDWIEAHSPADEMSATHQLVASQHYWHQLLHAVWWPLSYKLQLKKSLLLGQRKPHTVIVVVSDRSATG